MKQYGKGRTMKDRENRLADKGYTLADAPKAGGLYTPAVLDGKTFYLSGAVPVAEGKLKYKGKVPSAVPVEEAQTAAALCAANLLRVFIRDVGSLERIEKLLKVTGFVNADPGFAEPHVVVNGASQLLLDVLGEAGHHARSAVGMASLPLDACVEIELIGRLI
jgi:enamine deaminase RidA (YjgF/YER057c/UK114 family)